MRAYLCVSVSVHVSACECVGVCWWLVVVGGARAIRPRLRLVQTIPLRALLLHISKCVSVNDRAFTLQVLNLNAQASEALRQSPSSVDLLVVDGYVAGAFEHVHAGGSLKRVPTR